MSAPPSYKMSIAIKVCVFTALGLCLTAVARGQELVTELTAPPPMKFVSRAEHAQLSATRDPKERIGTSLELAEGHLRHAENSTFTRSFDPASAALGRYQAIVEDALRFIAGTDTNSKKMRDLAKRLEIALRGHIVRIEAIRRDTPYEYGVNVKSILEYTREARTQALNTFYSDTVVRDVSLDNEKPSGDKRSKDTSSGTPKKQL